MEKYIIYVIIGVVVTLLINYLNKRANSKVIRIEGDTFNLRLNRLYWYMGIVSIVLGILGFVFTGMSAENGSDWLFGLFYLIFFCGLGLICTLWYVNHKFKISTTKIESVSVFGRKTSLHWTEIKSVKFKSLSSLLVFADNNGVKVKAHQHLIGFGEILNSMEKNTNWKTKNLKLPCTKQY